MTFDESKHPRDNDGKFTDKASGEKSLRDYQMKYGLEDGRLKYYRNRMEKATSENIEHLVSTASPQHFVKALTFAKETIDERARWRVDTLTEEEYNNVKLFVTDKNSCVAIALDGNIISLCKGKADDTVKGKQLLKYAVDNGGDRLDAFSGLYDFYARNGFEPVSWVEFDENYAPEGWKPEYAKEPVIFWKYTGKGTMLTCEEFLKNVAPSKDYDTAKSIRDKEIDE